MPVFLTTETASARFRTVLATRRLAAYAQLRSVQSTPLASIAQTLPADRARRENAALHTVVTRSCLSSAKLSNCLGFSADSAVYTGTWRVLYKRAGTL